MQFSLVSSFLEILELFLGLITDRLMLLVSLLLMQELLMTFLEFTL